MSAEEEADFTWLLYLDPAEPRESFWSHMVICSLISSCLIFKHNYKMKQQKSAPFISFLLFDIHSLSFNRGKSSFLSPAGGQWCNVTKYIYCSTVLYVTPEYFRAFIWQFKFLYFADSCNKSIKMKLSYSTVCEINKRGSISISCNMTKTIWN